MLRYIYGNTNLITYYTNPLCYIDVFRFTARPGPQPMFSCKTLILGADYYLNTTGGAVNFQESEVYKMI